MIYIKEVQTLDNKKSDITLNSTKEIVIDGKDFTVLPALIDPHVHFRTPGLEYKEDWRSGAKAAIAGGYTTVFDMPNTLPPTITQTLLSQKKALIDQQLSEVGIPLRYHLFFGADKHHFDQIALVKNDCIGIKVFMGCSTGNLVIDDDESLSRIFEIAAELNLIVAVHAEDEHLLKEQKAKWQGATDYAVHSCIRNIEVACRAVEKAIALTKKYGTRLYILHVSTKEEIDLIKKAKEAGLPVFAETTPHHLFLNENFYAALGGKAVVNPPLRRSEHNDFLLNAIKAGIIDTIGSDHAPHTIHEKSRPYGECPSGMPGIETTLPLLLTAYHQGLLSLSEIVSLTSKRAQTIFNLPVNEDIVLIDLNKKLTVLGEKLQTKCKWSAFEGKTFIGWPAYTICQDELFVCSH